MLEKKIVAAVLAAAVAFTSITAFHLTKNTGKAETAKAAETASSADDEVHGVWLSVYDYTDKNIGLSTDDEATFRKNAQDFLTDLKDYDLNTVYMQVRSNDDAAWKSKTFHALKEISPSVTALAKAGNNTKSAYNTLKFDPLQIMVEEAHKQNIKLIAWMNPYRVDTNYFLNPGAASSRDRIVKAVKEVMKYDVDGVIFDDYFYHAKKGYQNVAKNNQVTLTAPAAAKISQKNKATNVNKLVKRVYKDVHKANPDATFGIAPQGNLTNDEASGADVTTWVSQEGYVDYVMPQLYWTNDYGKKGGTAMFTQRLEQFTSPSFDKLGKVKYIALALYRCGQNIATDYGWTHYSGNLADSYEELKEDGCNGYSLFSARYLYDDYAADELGFLNEALGE